MQTDKNAMALYVKVVENGSFSKTAVREEVPVSTVSRKIAQLEKSLGVRLLERSTRQLRTTDIGRSYFEFCRRGLHEFDAADSLVTNRQSELSGRLNISVPPSMSDYVVLPLVDAFQSLYPKVSVHCLVTERYINHITDDIDICLRVGHSKDSSLVARAVATHRARLVASPDYLENIAQLSHPKEVIPHVRVAFAPWEKSVQWDLNFSGEKVQLKLEPLLVVNDYAAVYKAVIDGLGISELPSFICSAALNENRLIEVLSEWRFPNVSVAVTYPSNRNLSSLVKTFRDFSVEYFERNPLS